MKHLIKAEFYRLKKMTAYWALLAGYLILDLLFMQNEISNSIAYPAYNPAYTGIEWFCTPLAAGTGYYAICIFLLAALYAAGDFTNRTFSTGVLCGLSRSSFFLAKILTFTTGAFPFWLIHVLTGTILWTMHAGFGRADTSAIAAAAACQLLQHLMLASHALFFSVVAKNRLGTFALSYAVLYVFGLGFWHMMSGNVRSDTVVYAYTDYLRAFWLQDPVTVLPCAVAVAGTLLATALLFQRCELR